MKKYRHAKDFWKGKGFYVALTLVIAGAATASFLAINGMMDRLNDGSAPGLFGEEDIPWQEEQHTPAEEKQEGVPVTPQPPADSAPSSKQPEPASSAPKRSSAASSSPAAPPASSEPSVSAEPPAVREPSFVLPGTGVTLQAFSGDELVFSDTLRDWRTHNGMDVEAGAGGAAVAPVGAVVRTVREDPLWGGVVELEGEGMTVRVCGLADVCVREGDTVSPGDALGKVGELPAESAMASHLHLEFLREGKYVDPAQFFTPQA